MFSIRWLIKIRALSKNLTVRATAFAVIAILSASFAIGFSTFVPKEVADLLGGSATREVLDILAKSMLVVVTFSMSTLIATYSIITATATPRATKIAMEDAAAHNALSTFLGAFIYSVVSIVALSTNLYGPKGRVILFVITLFVLGVVIATIIRWIGRLSRLGHLENLIKEIELKIEKSIKRDTVVFEWNSSNNKSKNKGYPLIFKAEVYGSLQSVDIEELNQIAEEKDIEIYIDVNVGNTVGPGARVATLSKDILSDQKLYEKIQSCFYVGNMRTFDEDPLYGINAVSELALRALSPGINDPGTAIHVVRSLTRIMYGFTKREARKINRVHPQSVRVEDIFENSFSPIARDAKGNIEVLLAIQESFSFLSQCEMYRECALSYSILLKKRAEKALAFPEDFEKLNNSFKQGWK